MSKQNLLVNIALLTTPFILSINAFANSTIVINELMAVNTETVTDSYGEYDDWIELYNTTNIDLNISGYYLSDSKSSPLKWQFPSGTIIEAGSFLIVWADNQPAQAEGLHAAFKLSGSGETVLLSDIEGNIIDQVKYDENISNIAFARYPDGSDNFQWQNATHDYTNTRAEEKKPADTVSCAVVINELMPANKTAATDAMGEYDDWIELYNTSNSDFDLSTYYLTNDAGNLVKWPFPANTIISAKSYLIIWMDDDETQAGLHANFKLPQEGAYVSLVNENREIAGHVEYSEFFADAAYARTPNGQGGFIWKKASAEQSNDNLDIFPLPAEINTGLSINELLVSNTSGVTDPDGEYEDWIEIYNNTEAEIDLSLYYLTDNFYNTQKWQFPANTTILPNGYITVWADENGSESGLHANFKLSAEGETIYLYNTSEQIADKASYTKTDTVDLAYARIPNGNGPFVWQMPTFGNNNETSGTATQTFYLTAGWNLLGFNIALHNNASSNISSKLGLSTIKNDDSYYNTQAETFLNGLQYVSPGDGYLAYTENSTAVTIAGYYPATYAKAEFKAGWNLGSLACTKDILVTKLPESISIVKSMDQLYDKTSGGELQILEAGKSYYFFATEAVSFKWDELIE